MDNEIGAVWRCSNAGRILVVAQSSTDFAEPEVELVAGAAICCRKRADGAAAACRDHELNSGDKKHRSGNKRQPKSAADAIPERTFQHSLSPLQKEQCDPFTQRRFPCYHNSKANYLALAGGAAPLEIWEA